MLKLVVLSVILALCTAEPSGLVYSAPLVAAVPAARSYSYRADLVSQPLVTVPVAQKLISSPVVAAPVLQKIVTPVATSYSARVDALRSPLVAAYPASLHPW
ncbi:uncharacterized protein LOC130447861 [Diorhabda sublineata]|uniref:uncharacterized protein LOC130447861 n=1 Tax=Diorhabda sublineata TaxID=1163346 RepID=UPI0024E107FF|nr:uncharacterized protein LOC130447861 [Diorhabda sublineata]